MRSISRVADVSINTVSKLLVEAGQAAERFHDRTVRGLQTERVELRVGRIEEPLPPGSFDLVTSALCVHHLDSEGKADLFRRVRDALIPGGLFVLGDVVAPVDESLATTPLTPGYDHPSPLADQLDWLTDAGFEASVAWQEGDLAVVAARRT